MHRKNDFQVPHTISAEMGGASSCPFMGTGDQPVDPAW